MGLSDPATKHFLCPSQVRIDTVDRTIWKMQNTSTLKEAANESENKNGSGQSTSRLMTHFRCDGSGEFVIQDYHRVFLDDQDMLHVRLECITKGAERGRSR